MLRTKNYYEQPENQQDETNDDEQYEQNDDLQHDLD